MKNSLGIGVVSSLILGTVAAADFDGLDYSVHATEGVAGSTTYRIYAVMDSGERLMLLPGTRQITKRLQLRHRFTKMLLVVTHLLVLTQLFIRHSQVWYMTVG